VKNGYLESVISDYDKNFVSYWEGIFSSFSSHNSGDRVWFAGPSAYVFAFGGEKFAMDLQIRRQSDFEKIKPRLHDFVKDVSFVLITHQHDDHMCIPLMRELKDTDIRWYIPHDCSRHLIESSGLKDENIVKVKPGDVFEIGNITVKAFHSPHVRADENELFAQRGYEISSHGKKLLFPGDVRDYDFSDYPDFGNVDICFSHLWAGNDSINESLYMPMLKKFADFNSAFHAKKYFLCHLYELGREEKYLWSYKHAGIAKDMFYGNIPESTIEIPKFGNTYEL